MEYSYPAIFNREKDGKYGVTFPDVPECDTEGYDFSDAKEFAGDMLALNLLDKQEHGEALPVPSKAENLTLKPGETVYMITVDPDNSNLKETYQALKDAKEGKTYGPYKSIQELMDALNADDE